METTRFDALAKVTGTWTTWTTRRAALALLAAVGFGRLHLADVEAKKKKRHTCKPKCDPCEKCKRGKCKPKAAGTPCTLAGVVGTCCGGICLNTQADETNCGGCGTVCAAQQVCQTGSCFPVSSVCPATRTALCPGGVTTACGSSGPVICLCSQTTEGNVVCGAPVPSANCPLFTSCTSSASCPAGQVCVETGSCCPAGPTHACFASCPNPV